MNSPFDESGAKEDPTAAGAGGGSRQGSSNGSRGGSGSGSGSGGRRRRQPQEPPAAPAAAGQQQQAPPDPSPSSSAASASNASNSNASNSSTSNKPLLPRKAMGAPASTAASASGSSGSGQQQQGGAPAPTQQQQQQSQPRQQQSQQQPPQQQQQQQPPRLNHAALLHQPHGVPSIGPSPSTVSSSAAGPGSSVNTSSVQQSQQMPVSLESPLPPMVQRGLGDRSNDKRKNAALEIEALVKSLQEAHNFGMVASVIHVLSKDFCTSMNSNYRKGGLVGLAATAIGLQHHTRSGRFLEQLLPPILHCFDDPEARVRYYACESLYNVAKVSRQAVLVHFNPLFEGLAKLFADVDLDVKNGANLLDRLIKDIVIEADSFRVDTFLPLLQTYIRRTNPYIRQLIVGWITLLDSIPDINMLDYLPEFLDGLFLMLSDSNREIRQAADSALSEFLRSVTLATVLELGPLVGILVRQCTSSERLVRLTAITWLAEVVHHPYSGGDPLLQHNHAPEILGAILCCISDGEKEIRWVAERTNDDLLKLVRDTKMGFELQPLLETLTSELLNKEDVPTKLAALGWINMLMEKRLSDMNQFTERLLPVLLRTLSDPSDTVVLLDLQILSRISLATSSSTATRSTAAAKAAREAQFQLVLNAILNLFAQDRQLLETRGSLVIRKLCVLLNAKSVYIRMAETLCSFAESSSTTSAGGQGDHWTTLQFISTMVQTLNLILLTASELHDLRSTLAGSMLPTQLLLQSQQQQQQQSQQQQQQTPTTPTRSHIRPSPSPSSISSAKDAMNNTSMTDDCDDDLSGSDLCGSKVFCKIFACWCHNPVATFSLCLLAQAYDLSFSLVKRFAEMQDVTVGFLMQLDKLVHLLESPIFVHLRLQLLNVEAPYHAPLLKSIYGILMCLPQGDAFRLLNERLTTVCNLRENLGMSALAADLDWIDQQQGGEGGGTGTGTGNASSDAVAAAPSGAATTGSSRRGSGKSSSPIIVDMDELLNRYDSVTEQHQQAQERALKQLTLQQQRQEQQQLESSRPEGLPGSGGGGGGSGIGQQPGGQQGQLQLHQQQPQPSQQQYHPYGKAQSSPSLGGGSERGGGSNHGGAGGGASSSHSRYRGALVSPRLQQDGVVSPSTGANKTTAGARHPRDYMP